MWMRGILLIGLFVGRLFAAQYYVDAVGGSDSNSGTSSGSAWRTCSKVENFDSSPRFAPGDLIQFRRGQTFSSCDLDLSSDGTSGSRITIQAYGAGAAPILLGNSGGVIIDLRGGDWWTIKDVRVSGNNYSADTGIDAGQGTRVEDVEADRNRCYGIRILQGKHNVTITGSNVHHNAGQSSCGTLVGGIYANGGANGSQTNNLTISNNQIRDNEGPDGSEPNGIIIGGGSGNAPVFNNLLIQGNEIAGNGDFTQATFGRGITGHWCGDNVRILDNIIRDSSARGIWVSETSAPHSCSLNALVARNLLYGNSISQISWQLTNGTLNFYNNTIVTHGGEARPGSGITGNANGGTVNIVNNLMHIDRGNRTGVVFVSDTFVLGTVDYNIYYSPNGSQTDWGNNPDCNFRCWKAKGYDAHGINSDPRFVSYSGASDPNKTLFGTHNFNLSAASPAIDAGLVVAGVNDAFAGAAPDLGTLESSGGGSSSVSCDLSLDGVINVVDVQLALNQALGISSCAQADVTQNGSCDVVDVQRFVNAALGLGCRIGA